MLMVLSICMVRQYVIVLNCKSPSFLAAFPRGTPPFGRSHSLFLTTKMAAPVKRFIFLVFCTTFVIILIWNALTHLIAILLIPITNLCIAVRAIQCKVALFVFRAGLLKRLTQLTITMTSQCETGTLEVLQYRKLRHVFARAGRTYRRTIQMDSTITIPSLPCVYSVPCDSAAPHRCCWSTCRRTGQRRSSLQ